MAVSRRGETVACDEEGEGMRRRKKKDIWVFARGLMVWSKNADIFSKMQRVCRVP